MEFHLLPIFTFLSLALVGSHAALSPEDYWKSVLPNTPIPKAVSDILHYSEWSKEKSSTPVAVGKGRHVNINTVSTDHKGKPAYVRVKPYRVTFLNRYDAENKLHDFPNVVVFFLEKSMIPGTKMNLLFTKSINQAPFLPRKVADSIPFSSNKLPEILNRYSVKPNSVEAEIMKKTMKDCEDNGIKGEEKYCATSLESMVDYSRSKLGKNVLSISTALEKYTPVQKYSIVGRKKMGSDETIVCHKQNYVYTVFYCHKLESTKAFMVSMVGANGTKVEAVAVCHNDTSAWNPKHLAFQVLKVKPGSVPICHFLPEDHITWVTY